MSCMIEYQRWLAIPSLDEEIKKELESINGNPEMIQSRFGSMLEFGTAGLRGIMGAGLNRMNRFTVRHATQGLANLIDSLGEEAKQRGVAVAYDCRNHSREFAIESAKVLAASGIRSFVFDSLRPTPELSFAVRELHCIAGINVTASHNPKEYNGYKVYWEDGAQLPPDRADVVLKEIRENDIFRDVFVMPLEEAESKGLIRYIGAEMDEKFIQKVLEQSVCGDAVKKAADEFKIIYTPFHGTGYRLVPEVLKRLGFRNIVPVEEQMTPDGNFPTVKSPNPEDKEGFAIAIELAKRNGIDLIIGTDPDADRVGVIVRNAAGEYLSLTGNQVGVLLTDYVISARREKGTLARDAAVISTIVSTRMTSEICRKNGVSIYEVLTGFKFIGEKIKEFEESGKHTFLFAFEESYGYLSGTYARDKDAVVGSMLIAEMAAWYRAKGMTLYDALEGLYQKYGYFAEKTVSIKMEGMDALEKMKKMMADLRGKTPEEIAGIRVAAVRDYQSGERIETASLQRSPTGLPKSNVLYYEMEDGSSVIVRPSGTEPKVKLYLLVKAKDKKRSGDSSGKL
ncbi:MAG TPA: phospho-sugar mutase [Clostridia bacterium]|nr:phospho-sugar mutase [Clostridia bacterium]